MVHNCMQNYCVRTQLEQFQYEDELRKLSF